MRTAQQIDVSAHSRRLEASCSHAPRPLLFHRHQRNPRAPAFRPPAAFSSSGGPPLPRSSPDVTGTGSAFPALTLRPARSGDFQDLAVIHQQAFFPDAGFPFESLQQIDRLLALKLCALGSGGAPGGPRYECLVAETSAGRVVGTATVDNYGDRFARSDWSQASPLPSRAYRIAYVSNVAVDPSSRRRGVASRLVREAERVAAAWGCRGVALHCLVTEPETRRLYEKLGYKKVTVEPVWKQILEMRPAQLVMLYRRLPAADRAAGREAAAREREGRAEAAAAAAARLAAEQSRARARRWWW